MNAAPTAPVVAKKSIDVQAPVSLVWKALIDIDSWSQWNPAVSSSLLQQPLAVGATFQWKSGGVAIRSTIQEIVPHESIVWTGEAFGTRAHHMWHFASRNGVTVVVTEESMSGWLIRLLKPWMQKTLERSLEQWLSTLKSHVERERQGENSDESRRH